jgi:hypothetical protein
MSMRESPVYSNRLKLQNIQEVALEGWVRNCGASYPQIGVSPAALTVVPFCPFLPFSIVNRQTCPPQIVYLEPAFRILVEALRHVRI